MEQLTKIDPLSSINKNLLSELISHCSKKNKIKIKYQDAKKRIIILDIICEHIKCENEKLYLWCYNFQHNKSSYLRIDRIVEILCYYLEKEPIKFNTFECAYSLRGYAKYVYEPEENEQVLQTKTDKLTVKAIVTNEFRFVQKMLGFANDCIVEEPDWLRSKVLKELKSVRACYYEKA